MKNPFTRERIRPGVATTFIILAAGTSTLMALATLLSVWRGAPGFTPYHLFDAAICAAIATGIGLRWRSAAWAGLAYSLLNTASRVLQGGEMSIRPINDAALYAIAIICIYLYPKWPSRVSSQAARHVAAGEE